MVATRLLSLLLISVLIATCSPDTASSDVEQLPESTTTPGLNLTAEQVAEAASTAPMVPLSEAKIDTLRLRVKNGTTYTYRLRRQMTSIQDTVKAITTEYLVYKLRVIETRKDGSIAMGMQIDTLNLSNELRSRRSDQLIMRDLFSSADTIQMKEPRNALYSALIGSEATVLLSSTGKLLEVRDFDPIMQKMFATSASNGQPSLEMRTFIADQMKTIMFSMPMEQQLISYPDHSIGRDGTWKTQTDSFFGTSYILSITAKYKMTGIKMIKDYQIAVVDALLSGSVKTGEAPPNATSNVDINQSTITGSSNALLDLQTGMTVSKNLVYKVSTAITTTSVDEIASRGLRQQQEFSITVELM